MDVASPIKYYSELSQHSKFSVDINIMGRMMKLHNKKIDKWFSKELYKVVNTWSDIEGTDKLTLNLSGSGL